MDLETLIVAVFCLVDDFVRDLCHDHRLRQRCARAKRQTGTGMLSTSVTAGSCPAIARSRRQSACLVAHRFAAWRANLVRCTACSPGNRWPKWRRK